MQNVEKVRRIWVCFSPKWRDSCFRCALFNQNCANRTKKLNNENRFLTGVN
jgi:hypothetical protein